MTFYDLAAQRFEQHCQQLRHSPCASHMAARHPSAEEALWVFHPSQASKVLVYYAVEADKEPEEVPVAWATQHGEVDERRHTYPDQIERVFFFKDAETFFWV
jgi:hypothetical protein